jgi:hypothetical protein
VLCCSFPGPPGPAALWCRPAVLPARVRAGACMRAYGESVTRSSGDHRTGRRRVPFPFPLPRPPVPAPRPRPGRRVPGRAGYGSGRPAGGTHSGARGNCLPGMRLSEPGWTMKAGVPASPPSPRSSPVTAGGVRRAGDRNDRKPRRRCSGAVRRLLCPGPAPVPMPSRCGRRMRHGAVTSVLLRLRAPRHRPRPPRLRCPYAVPQRVRAGRRRASSGTPSAAVGGRARHRAAAPPGRTPGPDPRGPESDRKKESSWY